MTKDFLWPENWITPGLGERGFQTRGDAKERRTIEVEETSLSIPYFEPLAARTTRAERAKKGFVGATGQKKKSPGFLPLGSETINDLACLVFSFSHGGSHQRLCPLT
jgi:hypothetical protein